MKAGKKITPKIKFGIAYFIQEQLEANQLTYDYLLEKLSITRTEFDKIVSCNEPIPESFAKQLSMCFSTSCQYWINLDINYKKWLINNSFEKQILPNK